MVLNIVTAQTATTYTKWRSNMKKVAIIGNGHSGHVPLLTETREPILIACGEEMNKKLDEFNTPFHPIHHHRTTYILPSFVRSRKEKVKKETK